MGSNFGYVYRHEVRLDEEKSDSKDQKSFGSKFRFFKFRTKFVVEDQRGTSTVVGSEELHASCLNEFGGGGDGDGVARLFRSPASSRLREYWMAQHEIQSLFHSAVGFARKSETDRPHVDVISVVVEIEVCTVQQDGEGIFDTFGRAIRPDRLLPMWVWKIPPRPPARAPRGLRLIYYLRDLRRIRVESVREGLVLMDACGICLCKPTVGDQITGLKCRHAFHSHCVVKWLKHKNVCPSCNAQEHNFL